MNKVLADAHAALRRAQKEAAYVRVARVTPDASRVDGFVVGVGRRWVMVATDLDYLPDGCSCFRLRDVERVGFDRRKSHIAKRARQAWGSWPPQAPWEAAVLNRTRDLIAAARSEELVGLHIEYDDPGVMFVGVPTTQTKDDFTFVEVDHHARWDGSTGRWSYAEISRLDLGGHYLRAIALSAGPGARGRHRPTRRPPAPR